MRKNVNLATYTKVKDFFEKHRGEKFAQTRISEDTNTDYDSTKLIIENLLKEKFIKKKENRYGRE